MTARVVYVLALGLVTVGLGVGATWRQRAAGSYGLWSSMLIAAALLLLVGAADYLQQPTQETPFATYLLMAIAMPLAAGVIVAVSARLAIPLWTRALAASCGAFAMLWPALLLGAYVLPR